MMSSFVITVNRLLHHLSILSVFRQGDEGDCWYIVLRGSVSVHIRGKVRMYVHVGEKKESSSVSTCVCVCVCVCVLWCVYVCVCV